MSNGKFTSPSAPLAFNDFVKSNGLPRSVHEVMPGGPSLTRQEFAEECDINTIMARYEGHLANPMASVRQPMYLDCTALPETLMDTLNLLADAERAFMTLPAQVRREFDNDPAQFLDYASDPTNIDQMRDWGLAKPKPVEPASPAPPPAGAPAGSPGAAAPPQAAPAAPAAGASKATS